MSWRICLILSVIFVLAGITGALMSRTGKAFRAFKPLYILFAAVFAACASIFYPIYLESFAGEFLGWAKAFLISLHSAIRLFIVDGEFDNVRNALSPEKGKLYIAYTFVAASLFVAAPVLTFSFVFSFLRRAGYYRRYLLGTKKDQYVFSELNEKSLALAEDLAGKDQDKLIIFTDVYQIDNEESFDLIARAEAIRAVCFRKDILEIDFTRHHKDGKKLYFFIMGGSRSENSTQALQLIKHYREMDCSRLFYFSDDENSDLLFSSVEKGKMKVKRVNMARVLIDRTLYESGEKLFTCAGEKEDGVRRILAVVVGLGRHGSSMLRALSWFCQMDGYELEIDAFDADKQAEDRLRLMCPDLLSNQYNGKKVPGEAVYTILVHSGVNVETGQFADEIARLKEADYVIVALGDDERNLRTAVNLRTLFARMEAHPRIQTIVYNSDEKESLQKVRNFEASSYDIEFFGDLRSTYCEDVIINSELEEKALALHCSWFGDQKRQQLREEILAETKGLPEAQIQKMVEERVERTFWDYEYNYRSSIAAAIHSSVCKKLGIHHQNLPNEQRSKQDQKRGAALEHVRWNAYMRSEGYVYSGNVGMKKADHMAKVHHNLVPGDALSQEDILKDLNIKSI